MSSIPCQGTKILPAAGHLSPCAITREANERATRKIPRAASKTWCNQINKYFFKKVKIRSPGHLNWLAVWKQMGITEVWETVAKKFSGGFLRAGPSNCNTTTPAWLRAPRPKVSRWPALYLAGWSVEALGLGGQVLVAPTLSPRASSEPWNLRPQDHEGRFLPEPLQTNTRAVGCTGCPHPSTPEAWWTLSLDVLGPPNLPSSWIQAPLGIFPWAQAPWHFHPLGLH